MVKSGWSVAAAASFIFCVFTIWVIARDGFGGLIAAHQVNAWASQILIDLVIALTTGLVILAPRARRAGINLVPWVVLTVLTGSIGFLGLVARMFYLEARQRHAT